MKVIRDPRRMYSLSCREHKRGHSIGFVPTMGCLHEGHLSLMRTAGSGNDMVVSSIFVNPMQFGPGEDFKIYPRSFERDRDMAMSAGCDVLFAPSVEEMYPEGYATYVDVEGLTEGLCGASRPGHFRGVATVVAKLFGIVRPDTAYFGQKDAQQAFVIRRMAEDLNMGVKIKMMPTVREKDGLAMSSRNTYLSAEERRRAPLLRQALLLAEKMISRGEKRSSKIIAAMEAVIMGAPGAKIDYISVVDTKNLKKTEKISGESLIALAVFIGKTRLIDNVITKGQAS